MNKRLFKPGDIVVCIDPPRQGMYSILNMDQLEFGKIYKVRDYHRDDLVYLKKWNGFGGSKNDGSFWQKRFILRSSVTDEELVFMKVKFKFGVKE